MLLVSVEVVIFQGLDENGIFVCDKAYDFTNCVAFCFLKCHYLLKFF